MKICTACGTLGQVKANTRGSAVLEIALWVAAVLLAAVLHFWGFLVPLAYSYWRYTSRCRLTCRACGSRNLIPADSPRGRALQSGSQ